MFSFRTPMILGGTAKIVTVAAAKGGVGKSTLAYELAFLLGAPLVDLDWDEGGVTRKWGYRHEGRVHAPMLDALDAGRTPTPLRGRGRKPDLLPGHPDFAERQPAPADTATALGKWAGEWGRPFVVVDTHPGAATAGHGAMLAAHVVVVTVVLRTNELNALEGMLKEVADYPLLLVPNLVPRAAPAAEIRRLRRLVETHRVQVGSLVRECRALGTRKRHAAVVAEQPGAAVYRDFTASLREVAAAVRSYTGD